MARSAREVAIDRVRHSSPGEVEEAWRAAAMEHWCPRCGAGPDAGCRDLRPNHQGRTNAHPHHERVDKVDIMEGATYL